jgi:hypothetical protein
MTLTTGTLKTAVVSSQIDPLALAQLRTVATEVVDVQVSALSEDNAVASVTAEQLRRSVEPQAGQLVDEEVVQHVACRVVLTEGSWLVAEFRLQSEEPARRTPLR